MTTQHGVCNSYLDKGNICPLVAPSLLVKREEVWGRPLQKLGVQFMPYVVDDNDRGLSNKGLLLWAEAEDRPGRETVCKSVGRSIRAPVTTKGVSTTIGFQRIPRRNVRLRSGCSQDHHVVEGSHTDSPILRSCATRGTPGVMPRPSSLTVRPKVSHGRSLRIRILTHLIFVKHFL